MTEKRKSAKKKEPLTYVVQLWGGISVLLSLISLVLPWWGIDNSPTLYSWGIIPGPAQPPTIDFFPDRLDNVFSTSYGFMISLVILSTVLAGLGSQLKRWRILATGLVSSLVTDLIFIATVGGAILNNCNSTYLPSGTSCISSLVGEGTTGTSLVTWGFKSGFYLFVASGVLILAALMLVQWNRSRGRTHPPSANLPFNPEKI